MKKVKEHLRLVRKTEQCIQSRVYGKTFRKVCKLYNNPWINPENAVVLEFKIEMHACSSGVLSFIKDNRKH